MRKCIRVKIHIFILTSVLLFISGRTAAQQIDSIKQRVSESLYFDISTILFAGTASINYEMPFSNHILFHSGLGAGYIAGILDHPGETALGLLSMVNFLTTGSSYRFEIGIGVSYNRIFKKNNNASEWKWRPAFVLGYRYQSYSGGFVFRVGLGYTFAFGFPIYISTGFTL